MGWQEQDAVEDKVADGGDGDRGDEEQDEKGEAQVVAGRGQKVESGLLQGGEGSRRYSAMQKIKPLLLLVEPPYLQLFVWQR